MKRAHDEGPGGGAKKPKIDIASIRAKLAATKTKLAQSKPDADAAKGPPRVAAGPSHAATAPAVAPRQPAASAGPSAALPEPPAAAAQQQPKHESPYDSNFDPRMKSRGAARGRRKGALNFIDRKKAAQIVASQKLSASGLGGQIAKSKRARDDILRDLAAKEGAAGAGDANAVPLGQRAAAPVVEKVVVPEMEWWDFLLLAQTTYEPGADGLVAVKEGKITNLVEHPVAIEPTAEAPAPAPQPLKLTKQEARKMRRQRREAREKEKQLLIAQGLLEPAKPKVKLSNMHRVYGADGVLDATAIEMQIRAAAAERSEAHEDRNAARKLTTEERKEKKVKKLFDSDVLATQVQVFRITRLTDGRHLYKINVNAQQNRLSGACMTTDTGINVVIVEGGPKSIRRFNHLLLQRIDWNPTQGVDEDDEDMFDEINKCALVWEGTVQEPAFEGEFVREHCTTEIHARQFLAKKGVAHYWDVASNFAVS